VAHGHRAEPAGAWREPVRGGHPDTALQALPGLEQLREMLAGRSPHPPLSRLTGMRLEALGPGRADFRMPVSEWLRVSDGSVPLGALTIPADAAMACAFMTVLPPFTAFTTAELSLRLLGAAQPGGSILARGRVIDVGPPIALTEAELRDEQGRLIAHGTSLCVRVPPRLPGMAPRAPDRAEGARARDGAGPPDGDGPSDGENGDSGRGPDPWERAIPAGWSPGAAAEQLQARIAGQGAPAPLELLTGMAPVSAAGGAATLALPTSRWLTAPPPGRVQGGVIALLADASLAAAVRSAVPAQLTYTGVDLKVNYLRPLSADGREARASARSVHAGRRTAVAAGEVVDADGRLVAVATGSGLLARSDGHATTGES
jgi:uncharacterized protein (TIGR00369 family)